MRSIRFVLPLLAATLLAGCSFNVAGKPSPSSGLDDGRDDDASIVVGYLDMAEADTSLGWVLLQRSGPGEGDPDHWMRVDDGYFYIENVPSGSYFIPEFGGRNFCVFCRAGLMGMYPIYYTVPRTAKVARVVVGKPGIYYMGAFRYVVVDNGFFADDSFELEPMEKPSLPEALARVAENAAGSDWEPVLRQAMEEQP